MKFSRIGDFENLSFFCNHYAPECNCTFNLHTQITNFVSQTLHVFGFNRAVGRSENSRGWVVLSFRCFEGEGFASIPAKNFPPLVPTALGSSSKQGLNKLLTAGT